MGLGGITKPFRHVSSWEAMQGYTVYGRKKTVDMILKFLIGYNEIHTPIRSQILVMKPMLRLNEVYDMIVQDGNHRRINRVTHLEASAMYNSQGHVSPKINSLVITGSLTVGQHIT